MSGLSHAVNSDIRINSIPLALPTTTYGMEEEKWNNNQIEIQFSSEMKMIWLNEHSIPCFAIVRIARTKNSKFSSAYGHRSLTSLFATEETKKIFKESHIRWTQIIKTKNCCNNIRKPSKINEWMKWKTKIHQPASQLASIFMDLYFRTSVIFVATLSLSLPLLIPLLATTDICPQTPYLYYYFVFVHNLSLHVNFTWFDAVRWDYFWRISPQKNVRIYWIDLLDAHRQPSVTPKIVRCRRMMMILSLF